MGVITDLKRAAYSGAVVDKAAITPGDGDSFYATDTDQLFIGYGGSWVHKPRYVRRSTAPLDFDETDFNHGGVWQVNAISLIGIVPVGTVSVRVQGNVLSTTASTLIALRKNAAEVENRLTGVVYVANTAQNYFSEVVDVDTDLLLDSFSNLTGVNDVSRNAFLSIVGYFI